MLDKPFKSYNGGKEASGAYQVIINHIPVHSLFVETFAGNATISRKIKSGNKAINDYDCMVYQKLKNYFKSPADIVENMPYQDHIAKYDFEGSFFYLDPPYLFSTRKSQKKLYKLEFSDSDHVEFLTMANNIKSNCMISHYQNELYDKALNTWNTVDYVSMTRNGPRKQRLYMNYPKPTILQDYSFIGDDFIIRQQIKRKQQRFISKIKRLPEIEKNAIINLFNKTFNGDKI